MKAFLDEIDIEIGMFSVKKTALPCKGGPHPVRLRLYGPSGPAPVSDLTVDFRLKAVSAASSEPPVCRCPTRLM